MKKVKQIGLPYVGSKRLISEKLANKMIEYKPRAKVFLDVFGGGGSMSLMFLQKGFKVYYNELNKGVFLFFKFILNNDFPSYFYDFIGRDEFFKIIKSEPKTEEEIIRKTFTELCYSFGNKKTSYFVAKEKEELAKQKHLFVYNKAKTIPLLESRYDITGLSYFIPKLKTNNIEQTRLNLVNVVLKLEAIKCCIEYGDLNVKNEMKKLSFKEFLAYKQVDLVNLINKYCPDIPKKPYQPILKEIKALKNVEQVQQIQNIERLKQIKQIKSLNETFHVEELQRINILNSVKNVENKQNLILLNHSYEDKQIDEIINSYNED